MLNMGWVHIPLGRHIILVWFWLLIPLYLEVMATKEWRKKIVENPGRCWEFRGRWPLISIRNISAEEMYPRDITRLERKLYWEGFPGYGWVDVLKSRRVVLLSHLDATKEKIEQLQEMYLRSRRPIQVILALLAGVARSALSISGIGTAHWATRALLMGSMLLAISSILTSALGPGIFYIFFGEDMGKESYSDNTLNSKTTQTHRRLTLDDEDSRPLLHEVDQLLWKASAGITASGGLFIAGMVVFIATANFDGQLVNRPTNMKPVFIAVALFPATSHVVTFWYMLYKCSVIHRHLRNSR